MAASKPRCYAAQSRLQAAQSDRENEEGENNRTNAETEAEAGRASERNEEAPGTKPGNGEYVEIRRPESPNAKQIRTIRGRMFHTICGGRIRQKDHYSDAL